MKHSYLKMVVVDKVYQNNLLCFGIMHDCKSESSIHAMIEDIYSDDPDVYLNSLIKAFPNNTFLLLIEPALYIEIYYKLLSLFFSVYRVYVDANTKLWGIGSEDQDHLMASELKLMFPFLNNGFYQKLILIKPGTYSSLIYYISIHKFKNNQKLW